MKKLDWIIQNLEEGQVAKATFADDEWFVVKIDGGIRYCQNNEPGGLITMSYSNLVADYEVVDRMIEKEFDNYEEFERAFQKGENCKLRCKKIEDKNDRGFIKIKLLNGKYILLTEENYENLKKNIKKVKEYEIEVVTKDDSKYYGYVVAEEIEKYEMVLLKGLFKLKSTLKINKVKTKNIIACNVEELV